MIFLSVNVHDLFGYYKFYIFLSFMFLMILPLKNKLNLVTSITFCSNFSNIFKSRTQSIVLFESYNTKIKFYDHIHFHEIISQFP
jgi:hypothetical protein